MNDQIAALLHEAGETHHLVYRILDGDVPWPQWYAQRIADRFAADQK